MTKAILIYLPTELLEEVNNLAQAKKMSRSKMLRRWIRMCAAKYKQGEKVTLYHAEALIPQAKELEKVTLIRTSLTVKGEGTKNDPIHRVFQLWTEDGDLILDLEYEPTPPEERSKI